MCVRLQLRAGKTQLYGLIDVCSHFEDLMWNWVKKSVFFVFVISVSLATLFLPRWQEERSIHAAAAPAAKLAIPTTTGTHTGTEGEHLDPGSVTAGPDVVVEVCGAAAVVVPGGLGKLFILVKMKGCDYEEDKIVKMWMEILKQVNKPRNAPWRDSGSWNDRVWSY